VIAKAHTDWVYSVAASLDLMASVGDDLKLVVYGIARREVIFSVDLPSAGRVVCFIDPATLLVGCGNGELIRVSVAERTMEHLQGHPQALYGIAIGGITA
jgi:hypothetical protein